MNLAKNNNVFKMLAFLTLLANIDFMSFCVAEERDQRVKKVHNDLLQCEEIDRSLSEERRIALAPKIAVQLQKDLPEVAKIEILQSFRLNDWSIIYIDTHVSDNGFLFYDKDPLTHRYIVVWGVAATKDEYNDIRKWTLKNAPGIPFKLADCFAWYVTNARAVGYHRSKTPHSLICDRANRRDCPTKYRG